MGQADEITLKSADNSINISGELLEFANGTYIVETSFGPLRIAGENVECFGEGCPVVVVENVGPVVWDVSLWGKRRAFTEHVEKLAELIDEKSGGDFTLNLDYGGLSPSRENLDGIAAGKFEMAQFCVGYHPEKTPTLTVLELPFLGTSTLELERKASENIYNHPAAIAEMDGWNATLLMPSPQPQQNIAGVGQPPMSLADFTGMKIRATGGIGEAVSAMGAEAFAIPAPGVKDALSTGEINAASFAPHAHMAFGTLENAFWWTTNLNPGTSNCPIVVNSDALEGLSDTHRIALTSSIDAAVDHYVDHYTNVTMAAFEPALRERGIIELTINDQILSAIDEVVAAPVANAWIADKSAMGLPAQELYDLLISTVNGGGS
jgi:TRAP-type C4-dicarboxylate transport system substrate-binding protein